MKIAISILIRFFPATALCFGLLLSSTATGQIPGSPFELIQLDSTELSLLIDLPWTVKELERIAKEGDTDRILLEMANENHFRDHAERFGVLHLATHVFINDEFPQRSKLVLHRRSEIDPQDDGIMLIREVYQMNLAARMTVLSACNTAYGGMNRGEGIMSLSRGFSAAGCNSLVVSLWPANDESTSLVMSGFYREMYNGLDKAQALRKAKLDYLKKARGAKTLPFYWAGFMPIGDHRNLRIKRPPDIRRFITARPAADWPQSVGILFTLMIFAGVLGVRRMSREQDLDNILPELFQRLKRYWVEHTADY